RQPARPGERRAQAALLDVGDLVVLGDRDVPALVVALHGLLEVVARHGRLRKTRADDQAGLAGRQRVQLEPPHAIAGRAEHRAREDQRIPAAARGLVLEGWNEGKAGVADQQRAAALVLLP